MIVTAWLKFSAGKLGASACIRGSAKANIITATANSQLDQIGFQDLVTWKMDATQIKWVNGVLKEYSVGKQPAWIDYMTNYNKTYGNFAVGESESFTVLNRIYQTKWTSNGGSNTPKLNSSTYIDPQAYNYVFADTDLQSMNF